MFSLFLLTRILQDVLSEAWLKHFKYVQKSLKYLLWLLCVGTYVRPLLEGRQH